MKAIHYTMIGWMALVWVWTCGCSTASGPKTPKSFTGSDGLSYHKTDKIDLVWLAEGFDFTGFDTLVIAQPSAEGIKAKDEKEQMRLDLVLRTLPSDFSLAIGIEKIFPHIVTNEEDVKPDAKTLHLSLRIAEFSRGSSAARYGLGYGAGMPYVKLEGEAKEAGVSKFKFVMDEKGDWFGTGFQSSEIIQNSASRELATDLAHFMGRVARQEPIDYE